MRKGKFGFSSGGKERSDKYPVYTGELYAIYILKEYQGNGLGKLLVKPIIEELQQKNIFNDSLGTYVVFNYQSVLG
ncbi:Acetyltransferase (GNAT) family protein [Bacillus sp. OV322]|uniref:GNAT family N-acetyltransferase n=1 Tax=Bacillus sp. OV322 TaxID=1882764 RepID=UPI0008F0E8CD|nr:GNAT family N-acetyltransferase [Bacillus sp. OV322]SFC66585.1 Acetyltransferase (GNAT) family protein [Bacillus sp. OV322]